MKAAARSPESLWSALASGVRTEAEMHALLAERQLQELKMLSPPPPLRIQSCVKLVNSGTLARFQSAGIFDLDPLKALGQRGDTLLFHGTKHEVVVNIQANGLLLQYAGPGILGRGLYGTTDPRKAIQYSNTSPTGDKFLLVCRFNLSAAQHLGPSSRSDGAPKGPNVSFLLPPTSRTSPRFWIAEFSLAYYPKTCVCPAPPRLPTR